MLTFCLQSALSLRVFGEDITTAGREKGAAAAAKIEAQADSATVVETEEVMAVEEEEVQPEVVDV